MFYEILKRIWTMISEKNQYAIVRLVGKVFPTKKSALRVLESKIGYSEVKKYMFYLEQNFDEEIAKIQLNPQFVKVDLPYHVGFHAGIVTNVLEYTVSAMRKGLIPIFFVDGHIETKNHVCLEWLYDQPCTSVFGIHPEYDNEEIYVKEVVNKPYSIKWDYLWNKNKEEWVIWKALAKKLIVQNDFFSNYIENDKKYNHIDTSEMLGVILRGTDYTKLKPKSHPVQPEFDEVVKKIYEIMDEQSCKSLYVATDEKRIFDKIIKEFGDDIVFSNSREYYDEIYRKNNLYQINDAKGERENDEFLRSVEYMSSMVILSECKGILGGNCSGSVFSALMSDNSYTYFFNKGMYQ